MEGKRKHQSQAKKMLPNQ